MASRNLSSKIVPERSTLPPRMIDKALSDPVHITKHGREHLVLLSAEEYARLKNRDRQVFLAKDTPMELLEALRRTDDIPEEARALNKELEGWTF